MVLVAFSARFSTRCFGRKRCISAGASVAGVSWNTIGTPSIVCVSIGCVIDIVGAMTDRPGAPTPSILPNPASTEPRSPRGNDVPN